jgi:Lrp/AsnC family transcriptional regulator for asnA, asnC and gidA
MGINLSFLVKEASSIIQYQWNCQQFMDSLNPKRSQREGGIELLMEQQNINKSAIDEIDQRIIEELQQDGRRPFTKIAAEVGISEASVRQRVSNLVNTQVIQIVAVTNPVKLGYSLASMIGIRVSGERLMEAVQEIAEFDEVIYLILCTGRFDILAEIVCRDNDHLLNFLTEKLYKVQGVQQAETFMYLRVCKQNDWTFLSQASISPSPSIFRSHQSSHE